MASVHFLLLIGTLTALSDAARIQKRFTPFPPFTTWSLHNLFEAVDVPKMIQDGKAESLYRVQEALKHVEYFYDYSNEASYQWGRSKALSYVLVTYLYDRKLLPLDRYGQDVLNIIAYLKESGLGLESQEDAFKSQKYTPTVYNPTKNILPPHKPSQEGGEEYLPPRKPSQRRGYF